MKGASDGCSFPADFCDPGQTFGWDYVCKVHLDLCTLDQVGLWKHLYGQS